MRIICIYISYKKNWGYAAAQLHDMENSMVTVKRCRLAICHIHCIGVVFVIKPMVVKAAKNSRAINELHRLEYKHCPVCMNCPKAHNNG